MTDEVHKRSRRGYLPKWHISHLKTCTGQASKSRAQQRSRRASSNAYQSSRVREAPRRSILGLYNPRPDTVQQLNAS